jgi:autotransporter-associated beta strand protein
VSDLTIDDNSANKGVLILSAASPNFYGNLIIGNSNKPTVRVMNDAALGNTTGAAASIGQVDLNGGTLQAGASFAAPERNIFLGSASNFDVNGFTTSWGSLTNVQRTLEILNSNTATAGAVTFNSLTIGGTSTLQLAGGAAGETVTLTNGINRQPGATLVIQPSSSSSLGTATEKLFASTLTNTNGIVSPWIVTNNGVSGSAGPYDFVTNGANGLVKATYGATAVGAGTATTVVDQTGNQTLAANASAYALKIESGKTITLGANTLTIGDGSNPAGLSLAAATPVSGGTLAFGGSEAVMWLGATSTINSILTGTGGLTVAGSGSLTLTGSSTLTGAVTIDSGTLNLATANYFATDANITLADTKSKPASATLGITASNTVAALNSVGNNSKVNISNGAALTIGDSQNLSSTLSATIAQTGSAVVGALTKNGSGMLDLSGSGGVSFATGSTVVVNGGVLRIGNGIFGTSATTAITLATGTELQYAGNGGSKFNDPIQGGGIFHLIGGTVQLTGTNNTYTGGTIVEQGSTLDITTANVSSGNANIADAGGLVLFDQATSGTYSGVISDARQMEATSGPLLSGSLVKDDSTGGSGGNVTLSAVQTYSGGTFIEAGTLTLGAVNAIAASSGVDLGRVGGPLGTGAAATNGPVTATLALGANNTIRGLTNEAGNNTAVQLNGNTLTLNIAGGSGFSFGGVIAGSGGLVMTGGGAEQLTGTSTYTGPTTVNGGLLSVNGSIASSSLTTVNAGGTLGGNGYVGNTLINGGTLSPGNSIGTLNVSGNLTFTTAAQYLVQISQTASDLTRVSGTAALAGVVQVVSPDSTYRFNQAYTILSAAGGLGGTQFNSLVMPSYIAGSLSYTSTDASLTLALALEQAAGLNANQKSVGSAIDHAVNASGSLPQGFANLLNLSASALPGVLSQLSGEIGTGTQQTTFDAMTQFLQTLLDPFSGGRGDGTSPGAAGYAEEGASAYASTGRQRSGAERDAYGMITKAPPRSPLFDPHWSVWAAGFGGSQTTDGNATLGANGSTSRIGGVAVGADYLLSPSTIAGFALAGGGTNFSVNNGGTGHSDLFQAGAFVRHTVGPAYFTAALAYGWQDITTDRTVTVAGIDQLRARFNANAFSGRIEDGYRFATPWMGVTPYAAAQFTTYDLPAYAEQAIVGANTFALAYGAKSVTATRSEIGLRTDRSWAMPGSIFTVRGRVAWAHDYDTDRSIGATFQTLPGASFVVNGAPQAADRALTTAAAEIKWLNGFSLGATFEGEFSDVTRSYAGKGVARYSW